MTVRASIKPSLETAWSRRNDAHGLLSKFRRELFRATHGSRLLPLSSVPLCGTRARVPAALPAQLGQRSGGWRGGLVRACLLPCKRSGSVCRCCRAAVRTSACVLPSVGCQCIDAPLSDSWQAESVEKSLRKMVVLQPSAALVTRAVAPRQASADANTATVVDVILQDRVHLHTCLHHSWKCKNVVEKCKKALIVS